MNRSLSVSTYKNLLNCYFSFSLSHQGFTLQPQMAYSWLCSTDSQHSCIFLSPLHCCWHYKHSQLYFCILTINDLPISGCYVGNILLFDIMIAEHNIMLVIWVCVCRRTSYTDSRIKDTDFYFFIIYLPICLPLAVCLSIYLKISYVPLKARRGCRILQNWSCGC